MKTFRKFLENRADDLSQLINLSKTFEGPLLSNIDLIQVERWLPMILPYLIRVVNSIDEFMQHKEEIYAAFQRIKRTMEKVGIWGKYSQVERIITKFLPLVQ